MIGKFRAKQAANVLEEKPVGNDLTNRPYGLRPHITRIFLTPMQTTDREGLAGWATSHKVDEPIKNFPFHRSNIIGMDLPVPDVFDFAVNVVSHVFNGMPVAFYKQQVLKARAS